jgi:hypothetical protein
MDFVDKMLNALHGAEHKAIKPDELDRIGTSLGVQSILFDMIVQWAVKTNRLSGGVGYICRPVPGKKRPDGKGWVANQSQRLLCTYFPDIEDMDREKQDWNGWAATRAGYARAATEIAPGTGKTHFHVYLEFPDLEVGNWLCNVWPTVHIDSVRSPLKAVGYVLKGHEDWPIGATGLCTGPLEKVPVPHNETRGATGNDKWAEILHAVEHDELDTIKLRYPRKWIYHQQTLMKMHAQAQIKRMLTDNAAHHISVDLKEKNLFLWGTPGPGRAT